MSHGSPPLPKRRPIGYLDVTEGVPTPQPASPGIPPTYDDGSLELVSGGLSAEETRARALQAAATLLGPILAALGTAGRPGPASHAAVDAMVGMAERTWRELAVRAESWIRDGGGS